MKEVIAKKVTCSDLGTNFYRLYTLMCMSMWPHKNLVAFKGAHNNTNGRACLFQLPGAFEPRLFNLLKAKKLSEPKSQ
ncbi:hypothetical protein, partial [Flavobacterium sp. SaA2.13]|uniref:hypothetical protein n=1 Tax=Flavobacterium sp. SaA2.13 TaxID=2691898 RepID=UPI001CEF5CA3